MPLFYWRARILAGRLATGGIEALSLDESSGPPGLPQLRRLKPLKLLKQLSCLFKA